MARRKKIIFNAMHGLARELLRRGGSPDAGRVPGTAMHRIDQLELLETILRIREEARALSGETAPARRSLAQRRIVALLRYMAEHLEMVAGEPRRGSQGATHEAALWATPVSVRDL
jgi:hypothetical protein